MAAAGRHSSIGLFGCDVIEWGLSKLPRTLFLLNPDSGSSGWWSTGRLCWCWILSLYCAVALELIDDGGGDGYTLGGVDRKDLDGDGGGGTSKASSDGIDGLEPCRVGLCCISGDAP